MQFSRMDAALALNPEAQGSNAAPHRDKYEAGVQLGEKARAWHAPTPGSITKREVRAEEFTTASFNLS